MSGVGTAFALLSSIATIFGIIQFLVAVRYDRNTQTFLKQDLWPVVKQALYCALAALIFGGLALAAVGVAGFIVSYAADILHPIDPNCLLTHANPDDCLASTSLQPLINAVADTLGVVAACLGGGLYLIGAVTEWWKKRTASQTTKSP